VNATRPSTAAGAWKDHIATERLKKAKRVSFAVRDCACPRDGGELGGESEIAQLSGVAG
jgi:hypothetical protein